MSEPQSPSASTGATPSAETEKERIDQMGEELNRGVGDEEPDPATAANPPKDIKAGAKKRGYENA
jgi:hypothetical protein